MFLDDPPPVFPPLVDGLPDILVDQSNPRAPSVVRLSPRKPARLVAEKVAISHRVSSFPGRNLAGSGPGAPSPLAQCEGHRKTPQSGVRHSSVRPHSSRATVGDGPRGVCLSLLQGGERESQTLV